MFKRPNSTTKGIAVTTIGLTGMAVTETVGGAFMAGMFLLYLTDYAGLGILGATIAPLILVIGRILDFVVDPFLGFAIDSARPHRFGKYRLFCLASIILVSISIFFLFSIPDAIKTRQGLLFVWVLLFYLIYSAASSLFTLMPLVQTIIPDIDHRSQLATYQRLTGISIGILYSFFIMLVNKLNASLNNFGRSFSILAAVFIGIALAISLTCLLMVHEGIGRNSQKPKIALHDILDIFHKNKAFTVNFASTAFRGLVFTLMTATGIYYTKWAYCTDLTTGEVDPAMLGRVMVANGAGALLPMLLSAALSPLLIRRIGSAIRVINLSSAFTAGFGMLMFALQLLGILAQSYWLFLALLAIMIFSNGLSAVPSQTIGLECIDYQIYKTGKSMAGMIHALGRLLGKAQQALSTLAVGLLLTGIGYRVDSTTGNFAGDLAQIPTMLSGFLVISALLPAIFSFVSILINKKYPINTAIRQQMAQAMLNLSEEDLT